MGGVTLEEEKGHEETLENMGTHIGNNPQLKSKFGSVLGLTPQQFKIHNLERILMQFWD